MKLSITLVFIWNQSSTIHKVSEQKMTEICKILKLSPSQFNSNLKLQVENTGRLNNSQLENNINESQNFNEYKRCYNARMNETFVDTTIWSPQKAHSTKSAHNGKDTN